MGSRTWILLAVAFTLALSIHVSECQENPARTRGPRRRIQVARRRLTTEAPTAHHLAVAEEQKRNELALKLHNQAIAEEAIRREIALLKHNEEIAKEAARREEEQLRRAEAAEGFEAHEKVRRDHVLKQDLENRKTHDLLIQQELETRNKHVALMQKLAEVKAKSPTKEFETLTLTKHDRLIAEELERKELALQAHNKEIAEEEIRQELARQKHNQDVAEELERKELALQAHNEQIAEEEIRQELARQKKHNQDIAEEEIRQELALEKHNQLIAEEKQRREEEELRRAEAAVVFEASEKIRRDQIVKQDLENRKTHDLLIQQEADRRKQHDILIQEELERRKQAQILVDEELERRKQAQILVDEELERRKQAQILVDEELKRREEHAILLETHLEEELGRRDEQQVLVEEELARRSHQQTLVEEELERRNQQEILLQDEVDSAISDIPLTTKKPARHVEQRIQIQNGRQNGRVNGRTETRQSVSDIARHTTETISGNDNAESFRPTSRPASRRRIVSRNRGGAQAPRANRKREVDIASFSNDYVRHKRNRGTASLPTSELERQQQNLDEKLALELHQADIGVKHQNDGLGLHETQANEHLRITLERELQIQQQEAERIRLEEERLKLENPDRLNVQNESGFKNSHQHNLMIKSANEKHQANIGVDHENAGLKLHAAQVNEHVRVTEERETHIQLQNQKQIEIEEERLKQESLRPSFLQNIPDDGKNISQAERHLLNLNEKKSLEEQQANLGVAHQNVGLDLLKSQAHQHDLITQQREQHVRMQEEARIEAERIRLEKEEARILNASGLQRIARNIQGNNLPHPSSRVDRSSGNNLGGQFALISFAALMLKLFTY